MAPRRNRGVITIEAGDELETSKEIENQNWLFIRNAYRTKQIITGVLGGIETLDSGSHMAVAYCKGFRVLIPGSEMGIPDKESEFSTANQRLLRIMSNMLGSEIDFIIKGVDNKERSAVASRSEALAKKRKLFYYPTENSIQPLVQPGTEVEARVVAVVSTAIRLEIFGVETTIYNRELSWGWVGDARDHYTVGEQILARVNEIEFLENDEIRIMADVRSTQEDNSLEMLRGCKTQGKYAGTVTHIYNDSIFLRLSNGVNAVAHSCYDRKTPTKKDQVTFVITHINEERRLAVGLISKIIKRNL